MEMASRAESTAGTSAGASADLSADASAETDAEHGDVPDLVSALNENPTRWWPGRTAMTQALNEQGSQITNLNAAPEPSMGPHTPGGPAGLWWLKAAPWFLPPPPEWGPIKQEMYANYYYKPVHRNYELPNIQRRAAPWYAPNSDADGRAAANGAPPQLPAPFPNAGTPLSAVTASLAAGPMGAAAAGIQARSGHSLFSAGASLPPHLQAQWPGAEPGQPHQPPSGPLGQGTEGVLTPPYVGGYTSDLTKPIPPELQSGPSPSLTAAAFYSGAPGSDGRPYSDPMPSPDEAPTAESLAMGGSQTGPLAIVPGGTYALTGAQLSGVPGHSPGAPVTDNAVFSWPYTSSAPAAVPDRHAALGAIHSVGQPVSLKPLKPGDVPPEKMPPRLMQGAFIPGPAGETPGVDVSTYRDTSSYLLDGPGAAVGLGPRADARVTGLNGMLGAPSPQSPGRRCSPYFPEACGEIGWPQAPAAGPPVGVGAAKPAPGMAAPWMPPDATSPRSI